LLDARKRGNWAVEPVARPEIAAKHAPDPNPGAAPTAVPIFIIQG